MPDLEPNALSAAADALARLRAATRIPRLHATARCVYVREEPLRLGLLLARDDDGPFLPERPEAPSAVEGLSEALRALAPSQGIDDADALLLLLRGARPPQVLRRPGRPLRAPALPPGLRRRLAILGDLPPPTPGAAPSAHERLSRTRLAQALRALGPLPAPPEQIGLLQTEEGPLLWAPARHGGILAA